MVSPFPGMDPYLEDRELWRSFHHHLAEEIVATINAVVSARYFADVEIHAVVDEIGVTARDIYPNATVVEITPSVKPTATPVVIPDAPIQRLAIAAVSTKVRTVQIYETETRKLVTSIEILSPVNKRGQGLEKYRQKRHRILRSAVHLVEIDLLRAGQRPGWEVNEPPLDTDYVLLVNRTNPEGVRLSEIWPVAINEPLPLLPIPLLPPDPDAPLEMGVILKNIYLRAVYARRIDYTKPPPSPKLRPAIQTWLADQPQMAGRNGHQAGNRG